MGRQYSRFCSRGHDKHAPHGSYVQIVRGFTAHIAELESKLALAVAALKEKYES